MTDSEWTRAEVVAFLAGVGREISGDTWSGYVARGQAPQPRRHVGRTPLWDAGEVRAWHAARRGQGWRKKRAAELGDVEPVTRDAARVVGHDRR